MLLGADRVNDLMNYSSDRMFFSSSLYYRYGTHTEVCKVKIKQKSYQMENWVSLSLNNGAKNLMSSVQIKEKYRKYDWERLNEVFNQATQ